MKYKAVIFDFDGTICDTGEGILKSAKYALDYYNIRNIQNLHFLSALRFLLLFRKNSALTLIWQINL